MKKLIILSVLTISEILAVGPEIIDRNQTKEIVGRLKDLENEENLKNSQQFQKCREKYKIGQSKNSDDRSSALKEATKCLDGEFKNKSPEELKRLSDALKLQHYGMVSSSNVKEIQSYLTDKLEKALTGVDPRDIREAQSKKEYYEAVKRKKLVDQSVFIQLYKTQVGKNALYEVSRFCFENFRLKNGKKEKGTSFVDHWGENPTFDIDKVTDDGVPSFSEDLGTGDEKDRSKIYEGIFKKITGDGKQKIPEGFLVNFFETCGQLIVPLCDEFKKSQKDKETYKSSVEENEIKTSYDSKGAAACLSQKRLLEYRQGLSNAEKVIKQMNNDLADPRMKGRTFQDTASFNFFDETEQGSTFDDLTSQSSVDMLASTSQNDKTKTCEKKPETPGCEGFYTKGEDYVKIQERVEREMSFQRQIELERIKLLVKKRDQKLEDYLKENGFFDIVNDPNFKTMPEKAIIDKVGESFEARKQATLLEIQKRVGPRQVKKEDEKEGAAEVVKKVANESKEERARLAQVVLFNNIITSHLELKKKTANGNLESVGRNTKAWKKEEEGLKTASIKSELFDNLKAKDDGKGGQGANSGQISGFDVIDTILGDKGDQKSN